MKNYQRDRELIFNTKDRPRSDVPAGAAQTYLEQICGILHMIGFSKWNIPEDIFIVGYADDIAAVIVKQDLEGLQRVMRRICTWMEKHGQKKKKMELIFFTKIYILQMTVKTEEIYTKNDVKYLGTRK